jgi:pyrophosphate--fructose-6-phosphate 1-phosphotransferase
MPVHKHKIAMLTSGGLAPCLSAAVGGLIERYTQISPDADIIGYRNGYGGLLTGNSIAISAADRADSHILRLHGGSPLKNSRVNLGNTEDCLKRGLIRPGENPFTIAGEQLKRDRVTILHTIGGDDTNTAAAALAAHLGQMNYRLTVVGLPKTVDNDIMPIRQSLGAATAAEQGARFFENIVNEHSASPRTLIVHEIMGRNSGWLTASTARAWRKKLSTLKFAPGLNLSRRQKDIDAVYLPELAPDIPAEAARLKRVMDEKDCVILFISEAAAAADIVRDMESRGEKLARDPFGHVKLDEINAGEWFARRFGKLIGAEKALVQKSGYFARSAAANSEDLKLIDDMVRVAVDQALTGRSGVVGEDDAPDGILGIIDFSRIKGGKPFDVNTPWFRELLSDIGQMPLSST